MNIAEYAIRKRTITLFMTFLVFAGGILAYRNLGRLEDPEFTIKDAKVVTAYPGATPREVEEEVTDVLETEIQQLGQLDEITSMSKPGLSIITPTIKNKYDKSSLPQVWDELRRKVQAAQGKLPPGVSSSMVNDDFGDVFGVFFAVTGEGFTYRELEDQVDFLRRELLLVEGVAKVDLWGVRPEQVFVEVSRARIARLGISLEEIYRTLGEKNMVVPSGEVLVGREYIAIQPTGGVSSLEDIGNVLIRSDAANPVYLKDIADIRRGYETPPSTIMRYDGLPAIGLGISTVEGGNVVDMGRALEARLQELKARIPLGIELGVISFQAETVTESIDAFLVNLLEAVGIVIAVLMIFMGLRSGLLIGSILLLTILGTFILMAMYDVLLQRISLGALIIALGMLVDNAIVVTDGILVRISSGEDRIQAAKSVVSQNMMPLFGATAIAVLAFAPVGLSPDSTGEYCRSLFQVLLFSLMLSWVIAITVTPLFCVEFLKADPSAKDADPYGGAFYRLYRSFLKFCIGRRWLTMAVLGVLLGLAVQGFGHLEEGFFPASTRAQFMVHYWLPQGTDIRVTSDEMKELERFILSEEKVSAVSTFVGQGALRFILTYAPEDPKASYGLLLVNIEDYRQIPALAEKIDGFVEEKRPDALVQVRKFELGPGDASKVQARFGGPDPDTLRKLAGEAMDIMRKEGAQAIMTDWRERVKVLVPVFAEVQARRLGINRADLNWALEGAFSGLRVGLYREGDKLLPIVSRPPQEERVDVDYIKDIQIWSPVAGKAVPLRQVVTEFRTEWRDDMIMRRDRKRTITVKCDAEGEAPSVLLARVMPQVEAIPIPPGYELQWGGEYEDSAKAQESLAGNIPVPALLMVLVLVFLFNTIRQPLIILLTLPLAVIGVTLGLLLTKQPFGFMALLGFLSLSGMLIKNAIVLIDQINLEIREGKSPYRAVVDSAVSRTRPVAMAALTTVLGMIPLLLDAFYIGMAVTIVGGLSFATVLTLVVVPVLYAIFYGVKEEKSAEAAGKA